VCLDEALKLAQRAERKPWNCYDRQHRRIILSHPCRQQKPTAIWLFDQKVDATRMNDLS
jgi:hypothetical protein